MSTPTSDSPPALAARPDAPSSCPASPPSSPNIASSTLTTSKRPRTSTGSATDAPARSQPRVDSPSEQGQEKHGPLPGDQSSEEKSYDPERKHASAIQGMLDGASLDISVLKEYSRAVLSRWVSNSFKWERQALWSVLLRLHERAETSGAGAKEEGDDAPQRIAKMQLQLLAKEWDRINVDPERRDHDYVVRVSVLFQALSVLLTKITHLSKAFEDDVSYIMLEALYAPDFPSVSSSYQVDLLGTLSALSSKHIEYFWHLGGETFVRMIRLAMDGISSGHPSSIAFAVKLILNILLDSSFEGSPRLGQILLDCRESLLASVVQGIKQSEEASTVGSLLLLGGALTKSAKTASPPPSCGRSGAAFCSVVRLLTAVPPHSRHDSPQRHSPPSADDYPYLSFATTLASFCAAAACQPPLASPVELAAARKTPDFAHGQGSMRVLKLEQELEDGSVRPIVVKIAKEVQATLEEGAVMRFMADKTTIPVAEVLAVEQEDGRNYLYSSFVTGKTLDKCWTSLSPSSIEKLKDELSACFMQLITLPLPPGVLVGSFAEPFFSGFGSLHPTLPPHSRPTSSSALFDWVRQAFSLPTHSFRNRLRPCLGDLDLPSSPLPALRFVHGDLAGRNLLVHPASGAVMALLEWEAAGIWPEGVEEQWAIQDGAEWRAPEDQMECIVGALDEGSRRAGRAAGRAEWLRIFGQLW